MSADSQYLAAFLVGLLGGVHCVGMCGGIVGALTLTLPADLRRRPMALAPYLAAYNLGRVASYGLAGALAGGVSQVALHFADLPRVQAVIGLAAGAMMVALGLYLGGWWQGVARLERAGAGLWRHLEPLGRGLFPVTSPGRALGLGVVWGWLPCGLVYSVLVWAVATGSARDGALLMVAFGLGTLPTLAALGAVASRLAAVVHRPWVRRLAGGAVLVLGLLQLARSLALGLAAS